MNVASRPDATTAGVIVPVTATSTVLKVDGAAGDTAADCDTAADAAPGSASSASGTEAAASRNHLTHATLAT
ncbi:hypothetical protein Asi02nite_52300 [Asanoa siamensis]|uniref:Uncharacterized protein n=1 Tax=Asanoa siamensis TaxID=926357 RepID=A0ABQ4CY04_9ACTN|nr:hypothetical protein Asi02nite_52300 [Asanoa siamensis]